MKPTTSSHEEEEEEEGEEEEGGRGYNLHHSKWEGATKMYMKCHHCSPARAREGPEQLLGQPVREGEWEGEGEGEGQGKTR